jgi:hypothetical protein
MPSNLAATGSSTFQCQQGSWLTGVPPSGFVIEVDAGFGVFLGFFYLNPPNGQAVIPGPVPPNTPIITMSYTLNLGGTFAPQTLSIPYVWDDASDTVLTDRLQILPANAFQGVGFHIPVPGVTPAAQYAALAPFLTDSPSGTISLSYTINDPELVGYTVSGLAAGNTSLQFHAMYQYQDNTVPEPQTCGLLTLGVAGLFLTFRPRKASGRPRAKSAYSPPDLR